MTWVYETQKSLSLSVSHIIFSAWRSLSSLSISSFSCSGCFQARVSNFPFLVLAMQINCIYIFLNIVCIIFRCSMLWWSSRTLTKKSQSQKRFNEQNINIWNLRKRITPDRTHKNYRISICEGNRIKPLTCRHWQALSQNVVSITHHHEPD
jgi:hypothetical protein